MTRVLYCGDTSLETAAGYLAGLMTSWQWEFDYIPSHVGLDVGELLAKQDLVILSDYPAERMTAQAIDQLVMMVKAGCGLVMLGGWESYHGLGGNWDQTLLAEVLPVDIKSADDRINFDQPTLAIPAAIKSVSHPILQNLPWEDRPPTIGGLNRITAKAKAQTLLMARVWRPTFSIEHGKTTWEHADHHPLLVVGEAGAGRVAAFASDVAPHWVGGLVDWGDERVTSQAPGAGAIEVGNLYSQFFRQMLEWVAKSTR
ncbi:hypothetical protein Spb1_33830 [Planctopirus ephydatiae]|uniref:Putative glutamine amidotransferase domain-containing protein n=1 Tax=Planctopirus ephydatiae TaxID=2528019 RepID=A0A518GS79_9PLAN|nr:glutamine amidotransferase [Planctopirus ephydatiae]QDV31439.1 hypothetical protein Spb1_33830 [Planctopirus ephydatiae]